MNSNYIYEIAEALSENHAALMVGAGFSKNAEKITITDKSFLNWNELSDKFYETVYGKSGGPGKEYNSSLRLAQEVEITVGRPKLEKIIKDAVPDMEYAPSQLYVRLMELPWKDVFTTNYDTLLERAADKVTKHRYNVVVCQEDLVNSNDAPRIMKLHGSFPSHRPFIITEEDYRTYPVKFAAMVNTVQQALLENVFCMLGFSCEDPNFINWIGWIHDNLGKSSSQKIYMISVSHMPEAKRKLLFERNIVVVDLEELWPNIAITDRLNAFFNQLQLKINEKEKKDKWFDLGQVNVSYGTSFQEKIELMHKLNDLYPGWIFLPWRMKNKVNFVLRNLDNMNKFEDLSMQEQVDYMYEYVKLLDIAGRPILSQVANKFWNILTEIIEDNLEVSRQSNLAYKIQVVYLHLLRTYRELADWEMYDACHEKINVCCLNYEEKQFFYACDCWSNLFRFRSEDLADMLEKWKLATGDLYWPLIKASMYAIIGELSKADEILMNNLVLVRRQLVKRKGNEYLASIEESIVSLLNFIRQSNRKAELEECIHGGEVSWWNENDKYCLHLNAETKKCKNVETNNNFDLSLTYTTHMGNDNSDIFYALEYLRFLEQTGHPFRLQSVTNTKGLHSTIKKLAPYYPHWCIMQILIAQEKKLIDSLFGRVELANLSREEVDNISREYIEIFRTVINNVKPSNYFFAKSIYEQSAVVLPEIISRFCYKCSVEILDEILDMTLELCISNVRSNFKRINKLLKGVLQAYTIRQQEERIDKILAFPIEIDRINDYYDPINFIGIPIEKYNLDIKVYNRVMLQIKQIFENKGKDEREAALNRLIVLAQIIVLNEEHKEFLCNALEQEDTLENKYILYHIDKLKYKQNIYSVFKFTMKRMEGDSTTGMFSSGSENYGKLINIIEEVDVHEINLIESFEVMENLVQKNVFWIEKEQFDAKERVRQSFMLAIGLLVLCKKEKIVLKKEEKEKVQDYFNALKKVYGESFVFEIVLSCFINESDILSNKKIKKAIWLANNDEIGLARDFYDILWANKYSIEDDLISECTDLIFEAVAYKMLNSRDVELEKILLLLYSLLKNGIFLENELQILDAGLLKLIDETHIDEEDSEQDALSKLKCRIKACQIAEELYSKGVKIGAIDEWKLISQNENEFIEVRRIAFEK